MKSALSKTEAQRWVEPKRQYAALPFKKNKKGKLQILLITSRETKRWVLPKGWPMKDLSGGETAEQEAFEEAGIRGKLIAQVAGVYHYPKLRVTKQPIPCSVKVYPLEVKEMLDEWPEHDERTRQWFSVGNAVLAVDEPELKALLANWKPPET
ncbi:NUDIX domain protein [Pseudovibrio axinellae]|uniref:NUDIX domain protein n=1 Tax=Pseudovibrio axinellae TaxID=989403 RepID=A0A165ZRR1_9HYPH|nr:NUDIX hydrolase [Pseudovibrio axinellae]KZL20211.1 NUDIX domain protein [Pseudovibrio axinellae]SEQ61139.1 8-oxo-dGTP pyrophosphatase MutT, NUDIX family [Pseudovibrio axinellae]